jgi:hypothetical protein
LIENQQFAFLSEVKSQHCKSKPGKRNDLVKGEFLPNLKTVKELKENRVDQVDQETFQGVLEAEFHNFCTV